MNISTQTSTSTASIPNSAKYAEPGFSPNVKPSIEVKASGDAMAMAKKCDGRWHEHMTVAQNPAQWGNVCIILKGAYDEHNLRPNVRDRFLKICPYDSILNDFKAHIGYEEPAPNALNNIDALNQRFDESIVRQMSEAKWKFAWEQLLSTLLNALHHKNLRDWVRESFFSLCTYPDLVEDLRKATGHPAAKVVHFELVVYGKPADERARKTAKAIADREARAQMRGPTGQQPDKHGAGKKGKNKKK